MTQALLDKPAAADALAARRRLLRRGVRLSTGVVAWNVVEGIVAVAAGVLAGSVALISFGIDSSIEVVSAVVVLWRLRWELRGRTEQKTERLEQAGSVDLSPRYRPTEEETERLERRTARVTGGLLFVLAGYIVVDAGRRLLGYGAEAGPSIVGIVMTSLSLVVMPLLGWAKLRTATDLKSASLRADAWETLACAWLSATTLAGLTLNAAFGWAWADPLAALLILPLVLREGLEGWRGGECSGQQVER